jgi:nucleotide-binding universal stress UspA family protein
MTATFKKLDQSQDRITARVRLRRILFATDFSACANLAMPFAAKLADSFGARLFCINVREPSNYALPPLGWKDLDLARDRDFDTLLQSIQHERPGLLSPHVLKCEGIVWSEVVDAIKKNDIDLVIIGTHGRTGLGRVLLGSQAEAILRHSTVPVYTIGPNVGPPATQRGYLRSIVFATDFGPASLAATPYAVSLAEEFATRLSLVHVFPHREAETSALHDNATACERRLEAMLPTDAKLWADPTFLVEYGEPSQKIIEVAKSRSANLIVLGAYASSATIPTTHSTVHNVITHAPCPVLTVPPHR